MKLLPHDATDDELLGLCRDWIELVAADRLDEALALLWVPPSYDASQHWTPGSLRTYIENYGSWTRTADGTRWRITSPTDAVVDPASKPLAAVIRHQADPSSGSVDIDVPLNGQWSDLTAQFEFTPVPGGTAVSLYDLHVL